MAIRMGLFYTLLLGSMIKAHLAQILTRKGTKEIRILK